MNYKQDYMTQKRNAKRRNIEFLLSFDEWLHIWIQSGHIEERGRGYNKYHMCRYNDIGPYSFNNVYIDKCEVNCSLASKDKPKTFETKIKMSAAQKGVKKTAAAIANNALSQLQRPKYNCPHCQKLISGLGNLKQHVAKHEILL